MIRMVQIGCDHAHAAAYRETILAMPDRIDLVGVMPAYPGADTPMPVAGGDIPVFASLDDLLTGTRPDAAQVMLPNNVMGDVLAALAREGINIWAEKPVARRASDLAEVAAIVRQKGLAFTSGYQSRFYPANELVASYVRDGLFGPLTFLNMLTTTTTVKLRDPDGPLGHLYDDTISGGGVLHWLGSHMIDITLAITRGRPRSVTAVTATNGEAAVSIEDVASIALTFDDGLIASLNYGYLLPTAEASPLPDDTPESGLYGHHGWARWNSTTGDVRAWSGDRRWTSAPWRASSMPMPTAPGYGHAARQAMREFADAVEGHGTTRYTVDQAMLVLAVIQASYRAAETGQRQEIPVDLAGAYATSDQDPSLASHQHQAIRG